MTDATRRGGNAMMTAQASRRSVSVATSLAVHAALLVAMAGSGLVQLTLAPTPILVTLVEASSRTAGPGQLSQQLRSATPAAVPEIAAAVAPEKLRVEPEKTPDPLPAATPRPKPVAAKPVHAATAPAAATVVASLPSSSSATGSTGAGDAAASSAPAWAPTARARYEELLYAWIDRHKEYPILAQRRGLQGDGLLRVRIDRDGHVLERSLDRSTGEAMLDKAALDILRRASPFPAVPAEYEGSTFEYVTPIEYRLH